MTLDEYARWYDGSPFLIRFKSLPNKSYMFIPNMFCLPHDMQERIVIDYGVWNHMPFAMVDGGW